MPGIDKALYALIRRKLVDAFGGEFEEVIVGGAPLNHEVEEFLHRITYDKIGSDFMESLQEKIRRRKLAEHGYVRTHGERHQHVKSAAIGVSQRQKRQTTRTLIMQTRMYTERMQKQLKNINRKFSRRYRGGLKPDDVRYPVPDPDNVAVLNYTSGTTGFSKGVMLRPACAL